MRNPPCRVRFQRSVPEEPHVRCGLPQDRLALVDLIIELRGDLEEYWARPQITFFRRPLNFLCLPSCAPYIRFRGFKTLLQRPRKSSRPPPRPPFGNRTTCTHLSYFRY